MHHSEDQATSPLRLAMPSTIAVATDLTDLDILMPHAIAQAKMAKASLCLIHALSPSDDVLLDGDPDPGDELDRVAASTTLELRCQHIKESGVHCTMVLERGLAAAVVRQAIQMTGATRLLVGTHPHGAAGQQILGHVVNALLRAVTVPIFVAGPHMVADSSPEAPKRILHPVSLTGNFRESARFAARLAEAYAAELLMLHVVDSSIQRGSYVTEIFTERSRELEALKEEEQRGTNIRTILGCGTTVPEILRIASLTESNWIVMGLEHDFPWWSKTNNAAYLVIAHADCPVLVVREADPLLPLEEHPSHEEAVRSR